MKQRHLLLALAIGACVDHAGRLQEGGEPAGRRTGRPRRPRAKPPMQFIARVNDEFRKSYPEITSAQWLSSTYINDDTADAGRQGQRALPDPAQRLDRAGQEVRRPEDDARNRARHPAAEAADLHARAQGSGQAGRADPDRHQDGRHVRLGHLLHRRRRCASSAASSANWRTCCAAAATTTSSWTPGRAGTPSPSRCARTTRASPNWSTKAPRKWASPTPARCGAAATT